MSKLDARLNLLVFAPRLMPAPSKHKVRSLETLSVWLQAYHRRLQSDDTLPTMAELAEYCNADRAALYAAIGLALPRKGACRGASNA